MSRFPSDAALKRRSFAMAAAAATAVLALAPLAVHAQAAFPSKPITIIVPFSAGGTTDILARVVGLYMSRDLGQPVVVDNRAGAGGNIGARLVAKSPPDGYTWIYSAAPMAANMRMYKVPGYDALKDFRHVMRLTTSDIVLIVNPDSGIRTLDDLVARARANPGKLN